MQVRNFLHFLLILFYILTFSIFADAQQIQINKGGEKIVVFPEGRWEYFDKTNYSHLELEQDIKRSQIASPQDILDKQTSKGAMEEEGESDEERYERLLIDADNKLALALERESDIKFSKILL